MAILFAVPILLYVVVGTFALWKTGLLIWLWWVLPLCWGVTWGLGKWWPANRIEDELPPVAGYFTQRDQDAGQIVLRYQEAVDDIEPQELVDLHFYLRQFEALARELAGFYHPDAADPFSSLTIPEIAAAIRLVADDLEQLVLTSIPGSQLLTVKQWRSLGDTPKWVNRVRNSVWAGSFLLNPLNVVRYGFSRMTVDKAGADLQSEVLAKIYLRFIRQTGFYLIEMNSGRLRGGADVYRTAFQKQPTSNGDAPLAVANLPETRPVTIGIVGQVSSGKSSLINLLTGSNTAVVDQLPQTQSVERYALSVAGSAGPVTVELLDSPGYGVDGANTTQQAEIQTAIDASDIILLVTDGHSPSKQADVAAVKRIESWYAENPNLLPPPVIVVMTHVDLIPPALVWEPPYDLSQPKSPKEQSVVDALTWTGEEFAQFSDLVVDVVAVCSAAQENRRWGLQQNLLPALMNQLEAGQSVALLDAFENSVDQKWVSTLLEQVKSGGKELVKLWMEKRKK